MANNILNLKKNAVFQLSLSSKELFHSNFLYWLGMDEDLKKFFIAVIKGMCGLDLTGVAYVVKREYKNFDLCICERTTIDSISEEVDAEESDSSEEEAIPGKILLVLENKFKSIPYKSQLDEYRKKACDHNCSIRKNTEKKEQGKHRLSVKADENLDKPELLLLTLVDDFLQKKDVEDEGIWDIKSYKDYVEILKKHLDILSSVDGFKKQMIEKYIEFVECFSEYISNKANKMMYIDEHSDPDLVHLRMDDVWQKLFFTKMIQQFLAVSDVQEYTFGGDHTIVFKEDNLFLSSGLLHGVGYCQWMYRIRKDIIYIIQLQGYSYRRGYVVKLKNKGKDRKKNIDQANEIVRNELGEASKMRYAFNNKDQSIFIYENDVNLKKGIQISEFIEMMKEDLKNAVHLKKII